ncbi:MAG: 5-oxoprolinase/urea amidolyase family protein, partial [Lautropia mirabilis]
GRHIRLRQGRQGQARQGTLVRIPVRYDGEDLAEMADYLGLSVEELVRRHAASVWQVAFTGFAPGFAYLSGGDPVFNVPRRASPRTRIPAGSVGLAGTFSAVYPRATPGGWQLIGTTDVPMWDLARTPPALLQPGQRVQFVDVATEEGEALQREVVQQRSTLVSSGCLTAAVEDDSRCGGLMSACSAAVADDAGGDGQRACRAGDEKAVAHVFEVVATGLQALFQDAGRPGQARQGVSASGALDATAFRVANQLLGNEADATVIELLHGGFALRALTRTVVAVTGATGPLDLKDVSGVLLPAERHVPLAMEPGDVLTVGAPERGLRSYLAVRGGFDVAPVLGSSATDTLAGVGPEPLRVGQGLAVGQRIRGAVDAAEAGMAKLETLLPHLPDSVQPDLRDADAVRRHAFVLDLVLGPRTDWFDDESLELLQQQCWQVTQQSNRVGLRLLGEKPLQRAAGFQGRELPSEGTALGALQVPSNGQPVLFLADHPLTGGYPVIGCVAPHHLDLAAQLPPGVFVRFKLMAPFAEIPLVGGGA